MPQITMRAARVNAGFNLAEAAKHLGISEKTLGSWENGETEPRITQFYSLCDLYDVPRDDIILPEKSS